MNEERKVDAIFSALHGFDLDADLRSCFGQVYVAFPLQVSELFVELKDKGSVLRIEPRRLCHGRSTLTTAIMPEPTSGMYLFNVAISRE